MSYMNPNSKQKRIAFGYNRNALGKIVVNDGQAAAVKLIFMYYLEGFSIAKIKGVLEGFVIPSPLNGESWSKQTISNILSNTHYLGDGDYPTIVSSEQFESAQILKRDNISNSSHSKKHNQDSGKTKLTAGATST